MSEYGSAPNYIVATATMSTKIVHFLCQHFGENSTTAKTPVAVYDPQVHDSAMLEKRIDVCVSSDFDMLTTTSLFEIRAIELPIWLEPSEYLRKQIGWEFAWSAAKVDQSWPESWQRGLIAAYSHADMYYVAGLLARNTAKMRSTFLLSIRDQVIAWLEQEPTTRKYQTPISANQLSGLRTWREYEGKNASEKYYWHSQYHAPGTVVTL